LAVLRSSDGFPLRRAFCTGGGGGAAESIFGDPRAAIIASFCCDANIAECTGVGMRTAVSKDCGRALVPATKDMFMLGREGSAKERAKVEKEGKLEDVVGSDSCGGGSCFAGTGGGAGAGG
jgi:hypothetical protein